MIIRKPVIGIMPLWDESKDSIWMLPGYMDGISLAGGTSIMFPFAVDEDEVSQLIELVDGVLFSGGQDIDPKEYKEESLGEIIKLCDKRDALEFLMLKEALKQKKPILGICRGLQVINVGLGGSLYQDIPLQHPSEVNHRQPAPYSEPIHEVSLLEDSPLSANLGRDSILVNSCHHQAIKDLAETLKPMAFAPDGLIEAVYMPDYSFLWAVQWHPEYMYQKDENSRRILKAFVDAASQNHLTKA